MQSVYLWLQHLGDGGRKLMCLNFNIILLIFFIILILFIILLFNISLILLLGVRLSKIFDLETFIVNTYFFLSFIHFSESC